MSLFVTNNQSINSSLQHNLRPMMFTIIVAFALAQLVFATVPLIDIWVSAWFYDATDGFWLRKDEALNFLRNVIVRLVVMLPIVSALLIVIAKLGYKVFDIPNRVWAFIILLYLLGPGLIVNGVLKSLWGRARPAEIIEFGGDKLYSPAFELSDQCLRNCSFVNGEGSAAAAFTVSLLYISLFVECRVLKYSLAIIAAVVGVTGGALRIIKGRHFLSDTVFSVLIICLLAILILKVLNLKSLRDFVR